MADDDLVTPLVFLGIGYLIWRNWNQIAPLFSRSPSTTTSNAAPATSQWFTNPKVQYAPTQSGQMTGTPQHPSGYVPSFQQLGMPAAQGSIFQNPAWNATPKTAPEMAMPDMSHWNDTPILQTSPNTGRSAPDAAPDTDPAAWALWESRRHCYYITGAPIDPPPAGC